MLRYATQTLVITPVPGHVIVEAERNSEFACGRPVLPDTDTFVNANMLEWEQAHVDHARQLTELAQALFINGYPVCVDTSDLDAKGAATAWRPAQLAACGARREPCRFAFLAETLPPEVRHGVAADPLKRVRQSAVDAASHIPRPLPHTVSSTAFL